MRDDAWAIGLAGFGCYCRDVLASSLAANTTGETAVKSIGKFSMKKQLVAAAVVCLASVGWTQSALAVEKAPKGAPVDFRACNFREGKTMKDLDKVNAKFREYANKGDFAYAAWVLTPQYHDGAGFDLGWLGAWPDGESFGVSMERWAAPGNEVASAFNQVIDCSLRHEMAASLPINAPESTPVNGVVMFYQCSLNDGKTLDDAYAAHLESGQAMKAKGSLASSWFYSPAVGAGDIDYDYYHVVAFSRYSDMGATMEMYVNGGGKQAQQEILGSISSCQTPVVFDALSVRDRDER